ncbi:MAG: prepilin-type N-terminal cleavage/methylation domain-containing protein [Planctomycetota bacterium]
MRSQTDIETSVSMRKLRRIGFTLVELVVVILIVAILASVAVPKFRDASSCADATAIVKNVRLIFQAVEQYAADHGEYPPDTSNGDFPVELEPYLSGNVLTQRTCLGGFYDWNGRTTRAPVVGVAIRVSSWTDKKVQNVYDLIEQQSDDSDPNAGWVTRNSAVVYFKLDEK